ncbi:arginine--tRNA ligase [Patescibacteria group bacterium]|nr:arginine--tRNA ligase [Patescibacteria group bacterium]
MIEVITKAIEQAAGTGVSVEVTASDKPEFGHYATNVAFKLVPSLKKAPFVIAQELAEKLRANSELFAQVEAVAPGFVNMWITPEVFQKEIALILKEKDAYGKNKALRGQKTIVEYTDPNPFKQFHIGHLMSNAIGESLSRLIEWSGAEVKRACYQGDVGMHVAKAVGILEEMIKEHAKKPGDLKKYIESLSEKEQHELVFTAYAKGVKKFEENKSFQEKVLQINKELYSENPSPAVKAAYDLGKELSLAVFEEIYKKLGTQFDFYFFESETGKRGKEVVEDGLKKGVFEESQGAVVFNGEKHGLHTRVFINSEGLPTYEAKELGLAEIKYKKYAYDRSIVITGNEVNDYFRVLLKAMSLAFPELAKKTEHLSHGMLRLPTGKMSSRTGDVITAESLIAEVEKMVAAKIADRNLSDAEKSDIEQTVAVGALKYSILKQAVGGDIIFDFEKSVSFEGDSGPYLQYARVRAGSILEKAKEEKVKGSLKTAPEEVSEVESMLCRFPEVVRRAGQAYAPNYVVTYLTELARVFNAYYAKVKIVDPADQYSPYKVALTEAFGQVMQNGLEVLGITAPKKM